MAEISYNPDVESVIRGNLAVTKEWGWEEDDRRWSGVGAGLKYFHEHSSMSELMALALSEKITTEIMNEESEQEPMTDWQSIQDQAAADLEGVESDKDAYAFIEKYLSRDLRGRYLAIYRSDRHEMNRSPRQALDSLLSLPPLE